MTQRHSPGSSMHRGPRSNARVRVPVARARRRSERVPVVVVVAVLQLAVRRSFPPTGRTRVAVGSAQSRVSPRSVLPGGSNPVTDPAEHSGWEAGHLPKPAPDVALHVRIRTFLCPLGAV